MSASRSNRVPQKIKSGRPSNKLSLPHAPVRRILLRAATKLVGGECRFVICASSRLKIGDMSHGLPQRVYHPTLNGLAQNARVVTMRLVAAMSMTRDSYLRPCSGVPCSFRILTLVAVNSPLWR